MTRPASAPAASRGTIRDQQKEFTRQRLIDGAVDVFARRGYVGATIDEIAAAAGASRATFYLHFKNKLDLVEALFAERIHPDFVEVVARLDPVLEAGDRKAMRQWIGEMFAWCDEHQTLMVLIEQVWSVELQRAAEGIRVDYTTYLPSLAARSPSDNGLAVGLRVWMLFNLLVRSFIYWRVNGRFSEADEDMVLDALTDLWWNGLELDAPRAS